MSPRRYMRDPFGTVVISVAILLGVSNLQAFAQSPPRGWRYPTESDYVGDWREFRARTPVPFHVNSDFNNDGLKDDVWLMIRNDNKGWAIFAFMGSRGAKPRTIRIENGEGSPQRYGLELVNPGSYVTACGKGYFDCRPGEPKSITLKVPGFRLFLYESASVVYFWDDRAGSFHKLQLSD